MRDQFRYSPKLVNELLADAVNPNWSGELPLPLTQYNDGGAPRVGKPINERGDYLAMVMDVRRAIKHGQRDEHGIARFLNGEPDGKTEATASSEAEAKTEAQTEATTS